MGNVMVHGTNEIKSKMKVRIRKRLKSKIKD